jgi:hypothetical protein
VSLSVTVRIMVLTITVPLKRAGCVMQRETGYASKL